MGFLIGMVAFAVASRWVFGPLERAAQDRGPDLLDHPIGSAEVLSRNELPYFVEIGGGFRVKLISGHERLARRAALLARRRAKTSSPLMGFTVPFLSSA